MISGEIWLSRVTGTCCKYYENRRDNRERLGWWESERASDSGKQNRGDQVAERKAAAESKRRGMDKLKFTTKQHQIAAGGLNDGSRPVTFGTTLSFARSDSDEGGCQAI